jgi:hypothetical protein
MDNKQRPSGDDFEDKIEEAIEGMHDSVVVADATGMVGNEELITEAELREGGLTPPA